MKRRATWFNWLATNHFAYPVVSDLNARLAMPYNEAETRYYLIDPKLRAKGYDDPARIRMETPAPVDIEGPKGRRRKGPGRTDYLICVQIGPMPAPLSVGLMEAKPATADPMSGMEQGKGYGDCRRFSIQYIFATNGHRYAEYDKTTGLTAGPHDFDRFPTHQELAERYARDTGIDLTAPTAAVLFTADSPAYSQSPRYYQDAAIRAVLLKVLQCERDRLPARILLALATGSGKTIVAANLLWRLSEAGRLAKPALFLCDRDELRKQALGKLHNVFGTTVRVVGEERGENSARNARVHIATYQTLGLDDDANEVASFLSRHYPQPNSFSVIIIDECHRSAWNRWRVVLERNPDAIQIGLTATPREPREPKRQRPEDQTITANNLTYFGAPVYEYGLIQAQEDGYLAACEVVRRAVNLDGQTFTDAQVVQRRAVDIRTGQPVVQDELEPQYRAKQFDDDLVIPQRIAAMCADLFGQLCAHGGPEQKVIVFCTRDLHADRVAMQLNTLYADWCRGQGQPPKERYAFKCTDRGGSDLIDNFRGSGERCFIACTVDLLATGVDIERLNAVCFFRYLESSISFYQMVGRGTRIHEDTGKYKFWLYDYTGVTQLFGTDFLTADPTRRSRGQGGGGDGGDGGDPALVVEMPLSEPVSPGTLFYNPMRILIGSIAMVDQADTAGITSPDYVVLRGKSGVVDTRWFYYWLRSSLGVACILSLARGAVRERMLFNRLAQGEIDLPPFDVQCRISEALGEIRPLRAQAVARSKELESLPARLLQEVFCPRQDGGGIGEAFDLPSNMPADFFADGRDDPPPQERQHAALGD